MAKNKGTGVYQLPNGYWAFRYVLTSNKQRKEVRKSKDELGNPFKTQNQAIAARKIALEREHAHRVPIETSVSKSILPRKPWRKWMESIVNLAEAAKLTLLS